MIILSANVAENQNSNRWNLWKECYPAIILHHDLKVRLGFHTNGDCHTKYASYKRVEFSSSSSRIPFCLFATMFQMECKERFGYVSKVVSALKSFMCTLYSKVFACEFSLCHLLGEMAIKTAS